MKHRLFVLSLVAAAWITPASAVERGIRARITGNRGDTAKCTIEVNVDDIADVEIRGDSGRLITLSGQPSEWRRMECTEPLPRNPQDFRFEGVDGRGRVNLVRDPREGGGVAVVHIEDPKGGREGYTFDLLWRAGSGSGGGYGRGDGYGRDGYGRGDGRDGYGRGDGGRNGYGRDGYNQPGVITCASDDGRRNYCDVDTRSGVRLLRQRSDSPCRQGETWGYDRRGIWVDRGCRADFELGRR